jgi:hypothetical protein
MIKGQQAALTWIRHVIHQAKRGNDEIVFQKKALLKHLSNVESIVVTHSLLQSNQNTQVLLAAQRVATCFQDRRQFSLAAISNDFEQVEQAFWNSLHDLSNVIGKSLPLTGSSDTVSPVINTKKIYGKRNPAKTNHRDSTNRRRKRGAGVSAPNHHHRG